ncbi:MAG: HAMP domain-containing sensor histidine kinase [Ghiorsea sp.]
MRHKLYLQIYIAFFIGLLLFAAIGAGIAWKHFSANESAVPFLSGMKALVTKAVPMNEPKLDTETTLRSLAKGFHIRLSLYNQKQQHIASSHQPLELKKQTDEHQWNHEHHQPGLFVLALNDGRKLVIHHQRPPFGSKWMMFLLLMLVFAAVAYPLAKRLTCRLERLQEQVDAFGAGDLSARADVRGKDEIAALATRFNVTAERIEQLIAAQKHILAGASHELRTPLTRMRMAIELMKDESVSNTQQKLTTYISELDELVDELLLASKLDASHENEGITTESIDLLALSAEEGSHYQAEVSGNPIIIDGNEHMLRRMLRNLLQNAARHSVKEPITIEVKQQEKFVVLRVCDDGPGITAPEQSRIFEPFYQARNTKNKSGNIGLGLSLVQKIATQHHGSVKYITHNHAGACFEIKLPMVNN